MSYGKSCLDKSDNIVFFNYPKIVAVVGMDVDQGARVCPTEMPTMIKTRVLEQGKF